MSINNNFSSACQIDAEVIEQVQLAEETYRLRLDCPEIAQKILPGQFFMLRPETGTDPLLGRPFALYDTFLNDQEIPQGIDVGYHVIGKMTHWMSQVQSGDALQIWGPLGNGFPGIQADHVIFVAGGIGYTPFVAAAKEMLQVKSYGNQNDRISSATRVTMIYGVKSKSQRADVSDWINSVPQLEFNICTEDGSEGEQALVTAPLQNLLEDLPSDHKVVLTCGPIPMMQAVAALCEQHKTQCLVSLESPMACGFGACFSCVVPCHMEGDQWDYKRICLEGPVFDSTDLVMEQL